MLIDHRHKIAYFSIPKVACTSFKHVMFLLAHGSQWTRKTAYGDLPPARNIHEHFPSVPWHKIDHDALRGYWKFAVVRDPMKRVLSAYSNKILDENILQKRAPKPTQSAERLAAYERVEKSPDLNTFCLNIAEYRRASGPIARHTMHFDKFLGNDLSYFDRIYPIEHTDQAIRDLQERAGQDLELPHSNKSSTKLKLEDLSPAAFENLRAFTAKDYALLSDFYSPPEPVRA